MKKVFIILITALFAVMLITSCKTREKCPAYGEAKKYKVETPYRR